MFCFDACSDGHGHARARNASAQRFTKGAKCPSAHARKNPKNIEHAIGRAFVKIPARARKFLNRQMPDVPANFQKGKCPFAHAHH